MGEGRASRSKDALHVQREQVKAFELRSKTSKELLKEPGGYEILTHNQMESDPKKKHPTGGFRKGIGFIPTEHQEDDPTTSCQTELI